MALLGSLQVRVGLETATFTKQVKSFSRDVKKSLAGISDVGSLLGGAGIGAGLMAGVKSAANFESSINQVKAASGATAEQMSMLSNMALDFGTKGTFSANEVAGAMLDLSKAGITPEQMGTGALAESLKLAATEGMALSEAAVIMSQTMGAFHLQASDAATISDALAGASISSTASVAGLSEAMAQAGASAYGAGLSINETAASLAMFAQNGIKGSDAGTSLKTMLARLIPQTNEAKDAMEKYGISFADADGKFKKISQVAEILKTKLGGLTQTQKAATLQTIFGSDATRAASILMNEGSAGLEKYITATYDKEAAEKLGQARTEGLNGAMKRLWNTIDSTFIKQASKGGGFQWITDGLNSISKEIPAFVEAHPAMVQFGIALAATAAAAPFLAVGLTSIAGALPLIASAGGAALTFLTGPFGLALVAAGAVAYVFRDDLKKVFGDIKIGWADFIKDESGSVQSMKDSWGGLGETFSKIGSDIAGVFQGVRSESSQTSQTSGPDSQYFANSWSQAFEGVASAADLMARGTSSYISELWEALKQAGSEIAETLGPDGALCEVISETWSSIDWASLGGQIIQGIIDGIDAGIGMVVGSVSKMGEDIISKAKEVLQIKSPSRVFFELGEYVSEGFAKGIDASSGMAQSSMKSLLGIAKGDGGGLMSDLKMGWQMGAAPRAREVNERTGLPFRQQARDFENAWEIAHRNVSNSMDELIDTGKIGFKGLVDSMIKDFASTQLKKAVGSLFSGIAGAFGAGGKAPSGMSFGNIFGNALQAFASFDGGGYTGGGSRTGGIDGKGGRFAIMHPQETVIDHTKISKSSNRRSGGGVNLTVPINLQPGVSHEELSKILPLLQKNLIETIQKQMGQGGRFAASLAR